MVEVGYTQEPGRKEGQKSMRSGKNKRCKTRFSKLGRPLEDKERGEGGRKKRYGGPESKA